MIFLLEKQLLHLVCLEAIFFAKISSVEFLFRFQLTLSYIENLQLFKLVGSFSDTKQ